MAGRLTFRQLVLSILALVEDLGHKEIGAPLGREIGPTDDELAAVEREVLTGSRLLRQLLIAACRSSREDRAEEGYPNAFGYSTSKDRSGGRSAGSMRPFPASIRPSL